MTGPPEVPTDFWWAGHMRDALDSWHMGQVIAAYRTHPAHGRALSQSIVAGWMCMTQAQLSRIEHGTAIEDLQRLRQWVELLRIPEALLWFKLRPCLSDRTPAGSVSGVPATAVAHPARVDMEDMHRRDLLRLIGVAGASLATPIPGWAGPSNPASAVVGFEAASVAQYGPLNAHLWQLYHTAKVKASVSPLVRSQLDVLTSDIGRAPSTAHRQALAALLADLLQLAGEIGFDTNDYTTAAHCYTLAATASKETNHHDMWACALIRHSFIPLYDRQFARALPMLDAATRLANRGDSQLPTRQWASTVTAHAHAGLGDLASCQRALDNAETVNDLTAPTHTTGWLRFSGERLAEECGRCFVELRHHDLAEASLTQALKHGPSGRRQGTINTDLAMIGARLGDADRVITYAGNAIDAARDTQSGYITKKLSGLQPHLAPLLHNRGVRHLNDHITHLTTTTALGAKRA
ncbi:MAG: transcriptional regulator [Pseudonocardia sp.]